MNYFPVTAQGYSSWRFLCRWDTLCYPIMQCRCFSLCKDDYLYGFSEFSHNPDMEPAKSKLPNYMSQKAVTQGKSSEVTWNKAFWGHFDTPQENILISGMVKYFVLLENVRQNAVTLPEKEKKFFGVFLIFFPKISTQRKTLDISALCSNVGWKQTLKCQDLLQDEFCQIFGVMPWPQNLHLTLKYGWMLRGWKGFCKRVSYVHRNLDTYVFQFLWCFRPFKDCI